MRPATPGSLSREEPTMLKTISAALLAVSVLAAPVLAATPGNTTKAPVIKTAQLKPSVLNANAEMGRHHVRHHHLRFHKRIGALKVHKFSKVAVKHVPHTAKRGRQRQRARRARPRDSLPEITRRGPLSPPWRRAGAMLSCQLARIYWRGTLPINAN